MKHWMIALGLLAGTLGGLDAADARVPFARHRFKHQQKRIGKGVKSGQLTGREALRLEQQQAHIARGAYKAKSDGEITGQERRRMFRAQNKASRNIFVAKHNRRRR